MRKIWPLVFALLCAAPAAADEIDRETAEGLPDRGQDPGASPHTDAIEHYERGNYRIALEFFEYSAHWADKVSQHNLGVMHYLGQGTPRDPARAWAWFELAAERKYPQFVEVADKAWSELDEDERVRARRILEEELLPEYGDHVAVDRTAKRMERERRNMTGSRTGFVPLGLRIIDRHGNQFSGDEFYADERWDFHKMIELESRLFDALRRGRVRVSPLETLGDGDDPE